MEVFYGSSSCHEVVFIHKFIVHQKLLSSISFSLQISLFFHCLHTFDLTSFISSLIVSPLARCLDLIQSQCPFYTELFISFVPSSFFSIVSSHLVGFFLFLPIELKKPSFCNSIFGKPTLCTFFVQRENDQQPCHTQLCTNSSVWFFRNLGIPKKNHIIFGPMLKCRNPHFHPNKNLL